MNLLIHVGSTESLRVPGNGERRAAWAHKYYRLDLPRDGELRARLAAGLAADARRVLRARPAKRLPQ